MRAMSEHLARVNAARDDASQLARVLLQFEHARIVSIGGQDAGLLKAYREQSQWYIAQIQISPQFQGQGLGRAIIEKVLEQASRERLPTALKVLTGNPARRLYEALGFKEISQEDAEHLMVCPPRPERISAAG